MLLILKKTLTHGGRNILESSGENATSLVRSELNSFTYQTKGSIFRGLLGFMGVIVFVMILSVLFLSLFPSVILSLQTSTSAFRWCE